MKTTSLAAAAALAVAAGAIVVAPVQAAPASTASPNQPAYFNQYSSLRMERDSAGVLTVTFNSRGGAIAVTSRDQSDFADAFRRIAEDPDNRIVVLAGAGDDFLPAFDIHGRSDESLEAAQTLDEGGALIEALAAIRAPVIAAVEGRSWVHSELVLRADFIVAGEGATFNERPVSGLPTSALFDAWSDRIGRARAEAFLLNPLPLSATGAAAWGVVDEVVADGLALARARRVAIDAFQA